MNNFINNFNNVYLYIFRIIIELKKITHTYMQIFVEMLLIII